MVIIAQAPDRSAIAHSASAVPAQKVMNRVKGNCTINVVCCNLFHYAEYNALLCCCYLQ